MDRAQLAAFLKARRAAIQPEDVGLPRGVCRRACSARWPATAAPHLGRGTGCQDPFGGSPDRRQSPTLLAVPRSPRRPRAIAVRVLIAGLIDLFAFSAANFVADLVGHATGRTGLFLPVSYVLLAPFVAWLAPKVSYRRRDALFAPWAFLIVAWRVAYLPYRDWAPRDDEAAQAHYLRAAEFGRAWDPEYAGLWRLLPAMSHSSRPGSEDRGIR